MRIRALIPAFAAALAGALLTPALAAAANGEATPLNLGGSADGAKAVAETGTSGGTRDQIEDFVHGSDEIDLATIDANTTAAGNQAFAFIGAAAFSGVAGQLRAVQSAVDTVISGDINGDSVADFQIQLNTVVTLTAGDFVL